MNATADRPVSTESLSVAELIGVMLGHWRILLAGSLIGLLLAVVYVWQFSPLFRSRGIFNLQYISFAEYKRYSPALADRDRFLEYAARKHQFSDAQLESIRRAINGPDALNKWIHPVFTITKTDVKDVAETPRDAFQFTGVEIDIGLNSRELAQKLLLVCGDYVRDFVIEGRIFDLVVPSLTTSLVELQRKEIDILTENFELDQLKRRRDQLKGVANRYPGAAREVQHQVVSTQEGGNRYLSPLTQVVGLEAQIIEGNSRLARMKRETDRLRTLINFYSEARARIVAGKTGDQLSALADIFEQLQKAPDANDEAVRDAIATIRVELDQLRALSSDYMRFAGAPSTQDQFRSISVWSPMILGPIVGLLLAILVAIVAEWWSRNRTEVFRTSRRSGSR
jgi:hypothetical protein